MSGAWPLPAATVRVATALAGAVGRGRLALERRRAPDQAGRDHLVAGGPADRLLRQAARPLSLVTGHWEHQPYDEDWFETDGLRLHYETHGDGDRVAVLLHGLLLDSRMNRRLAGDLARRGNRVVLLDLPGHGRSDRPTHASAHRMDLYARSVVALLDELHVERAVVGGVSLGAGVALHVAEQAPARTAAMVLEMPVLERAVPSAALTFLPLLLAVRAGAPAVGAVASVVRRLPPTGIGVLDAFVSVGGADPRQTAAVLHGMLVGPVAPPLAARQAMTMPALVIGHRLDAVHPFSDAAHLVTELPHAQLVEARSIAELRTFPERLTGAIADFLDQVWSGESITRTAALDPTGTRPGQTRTAPPMPQAPQAGRA